VFDQRTTDFFGQGEIRRYKARAAVVRHSVFPFLSGQLLPSRRAVM
jgi:hypothetical protein